MGLLWRNPERIAVAALAVAAALLGWSRWGRYEDAASLRSQIERDGETIKQQGLRAPTPAELPAPPILAADAAPREAWPANRSLLFRDVIEHPKPRETVQGPDHVAPKPLRRIPVAIVRGAIDPAPLDPGKAVRAWRFEGDGGAVRITEGKGPEGRRILLAEAAGEKGQKAIVRVEPEGDEAVLYEIQIERDVRLPEIAEVAAAAAEARVTVSWRAGNGGPDAGLRGYLVERAEAGPGVAEGAAAFTPIRAIGARPGFVPAAGAAGGQLEDSDVRPEAHYRYRVRPIAGPAPGALGERLGGWKESASAKTPAEIMLIYRGKRAAGGKSEGQFGVRKFFRDRHTWGPGEQTFWVPVLDDKGDGSSGIGKAVSHSDGGKVPESWDYSTGHVLVDLVEERVPQPPITRVRKGPDGKPVLDKDGKPEMETVPQPDASVSRAVLLDPEERTLRIDIGRGKAESPPAQPLPAEETPPPTSQRAYGQKPDYYWVLVEDVNSDETRLVLVDGGGARAVVAPSEPIHGLGFEKGKILKAKVGEKESALRSPLTRKDAAFRTLSDWTPPGGERIDAVLVSAGRWDDRRFFRVRIEDAKDDRVLVLTDKNGAQAIVEVSGSAGASTYGFSKGNVVEARVGYRTAELLSAKDRRRVSFRVVSNWQK